MSSAGAGSPPRDLARRDRPRGVHMRPLREEGDPWVVLRTLWGWWTKGSLSQPYLLPGPHASSPPPHCSGPINWGWGKHRGILTS